MATGTVVPFPVPGVAGAEDTIEGVVILYEEMLERVCNCSPSSGCSGRPIPAKNVYHVTCPGET